MTEIDYIIWKSGRDSHSFCQWGSCHAIHLGLDLFAVFQKTATLGDGYDDRNNKDKPFSFTEKETFSGVTILAAAEVCCLQFDILASTFLLCTVQNRLFFFWKPLHCCKSFLSLVTRGTFSSKIRRNKRGTASWQKCRVLHLIFATSCFVANCKEWRTILLAVWHVRCNLLCSFV